MLAGCSLVVSPDEVRLGPDAGTDTGRPDTMTDSGLDSAVDSAVDSGVDSAVDSGGPDTDMPDTDMPDTARPDTGPPPECVGDASCPPRTGTIARCIDNECVYACVEGLADCDMSSDNGCETALDTALNCGACGATCELTNAIAGCRDGGCVVADCLEGFEDCNGVAGDGCEADLRDAATCGACGRTCAADEICAGDRCVSTCAPPNLMCGAACVDPSSDPRNCGRCGVTCDFPNATAACSRRGCEITGCLPGFEDCDRNPANGCEARLDTLTHCGACGSRCQRANATASCESGSCTIAMCNANYGNCDGRDNNGCEADLRTDIDHCASCGTECVDEARASGMCRGGCEYTCDAGYGDCDGSLGDGTNGCESDLDSDASNCGGCGVTCESGTCIDGACLFVCPAGTCEVDGSCAPIDSADDVCSRAARLSFIPGDDDGDVRTVTSFGPGLFRIRVTESRNSGPRRDLSVTARLEGPRDMDYDLEGWCENCGNEADAVRSRGSESNESVTLWWEDADDSDTMDVWFRVVVFDSSANNCDPWTLSITGNTSILGDPTCDSPGD